MGHYKHLTPIEREKIFLSYSQNTTLTYIAKTIHRDKSTVLREINTRTRTGAREADTVIDKRGGACLVTLLDRKRGFLLSSKAKKKDSLSVKDTMISCLKGQACHSITRDRVMEFAKHAEISIALEKVKFFFITTSSLATWDK